MSGDLVILIDVLSKTIERLERLKFTNGLMLKNTMKTI